MLKKIRLILGTMTFGEQVFDTDVTDMLQMFFGYGYRELDTAYVYNEGKCENLLGNAFTKFSREAYEVATKVNPRITGRLDKEAVMLQANESLKRMEIAYVDTLYLHFPDPGTPIESALEGCAALYEEGKFRELGISNFPAWLVAETYHICKKHGWVLPSVYEGLYNPLSRHAERELDRALDYYGIRYYAYNPLAGGLLTDKYATKDPQLKEGRFINRPNYQKRYWKNSYFRATESIKQACINCDIGIVEAVYRWMMFHSMLKAERGDGIIIGASRLTQLEQNLEACRKGRLPDDLVNVIERAWEISRSDAPEYFTYYMPSKS
ncbi:MAG: aldo/keto reductase [Lachnospiraceae bacterium]|nr:aldo/keto reductase [Lachnospiraceae bacterium]